MTIKANDVKEKLQYALSVSEQSFDVMGVDVEIWHDQFAENPYENCDGMAPAIWFYESYMEYGGYDIESVIWRMSPSFVSRHWRKIESILDNADTNEPSAIQRDYGGDMGTIRQGYYAECLADMRGNSWGYVCDYLEAIAALYRLQGIAADTFQSNGYCQGDSSRGLIVHLPEWKEKVGFNGDSAKDMQSECEVYGAWAWGDVYGFTVDEEDSCGGFYGFDVDHICEMIADSINSVLEDRTTVAANAMMHERLDLYAIA